MAMRTIDKVTLRKVKSARTILNKVLAEATDSVHTRMIQRIVRDLEVIISFNERRSRQGG